MLLCTLYAILTTFLEHSKATTTTTTTTTTLISNSEPRLDTLNNVVDAHNGNIVFVNDTYYLYGEYYGNHNFAVSGSTKLPKLSVYTSKNLKSGSWIFRGLLHNNTSPGWASMESKWPWAPAGVRVKQLILSVCTTIRILPYLLQ